MLVFSLITMVITVETRGVCKTSLYFLFLAFHFERSLSLSLSLSHLLILHCMYLCFHSYNDNNYYDGISKKKEASIKFVFSSSIHVSIYHPLLCPLYNNFTAVVYMSIKQSFPRVFTTYPYAVLMLPHMHVYVYTREVTC